MPKNCSEYCRKELQELRRDNSFIPGPDYSPGSQFSAEFVMLKRSAVSALKHLNSRFQLVFPVEILRPSLPAVGRQTALGLRMTISFMVGKRNHFFGRDSGGTMPFAL